MRITIFLITICLLITTGATYAQPDTLWTRTFGGEGEDYDCGYSVQQTVDGGFIIAGVTGSDLWLIKTDEEGSEEWNRTFRGGNREEGHSVQQTVDGGFVVAGWTRSFGAGNCDVWLIKTDEEGDSVWSHTFGGENQDLGYNVQRTEDHGFIIVGSTRSFGAGGDDVWLIKTDEEGREQWNCTLGGEDRDWGSCVQQTTDGGFIITGTTSSFGAGAYDVWLIKTDEDGDSLWSRTFGGGDWDGGHSVQQTADGGYVITGHTRASENDFGYFWLIKTDEAGREQWNRTFGGEINGGGNSVQQTLDGGFIIAGGYGNIELNPDDVWLIKTDEDGDSLWSLTFGGEFIDCGYSVQLTEDGGYIVAGRRGLDIGDVWLVKTTMDMLQWLSLPDTGFVQDRSLTIDLDYFYDYISPSIEIDTLLNFEVVDGEHVQGEIEDDELTITSEQDWFGQDSFMLIVSEIANEDNRDSTYLRLTVTEFNAVEKIEPFIPSEFGISSINPNPFNSTTTITYALPVAAPVSLKLYDLSGREVKTLVEGNVQAGVHSVNINANDLVSGLYFVRLEADGQMFNQKIVLIR